MQSLCETRELAVSELVEAALIGRVTGIESCCIEGAEPSYQGLYEALEVGGVLVGMKDPELYDCDRWMWLAACITHKNLQLFASVHESEALHSLIEDCVSSL